MANSRVELSVSGTSETWFHKNIYCPSCGAPGVWQLENPCVLDYELLNICVACGGSFYMSLSAVRFDEVDEIRRTAILHNSKACQKT
jgi:hypothetical protein